VRRAVSTGRPNGKESWVEATAKRLGLNLSEPVGVHPSRPTKCSDTYYPCGLGPHFAPGGRTHQWM